MRDNNKNLATPMAVFTYSRFSTDRQTEASIIDQQRAQREYAARHGFAIAADFVDEGISGAATGNRPGVLQLLETVSAGDLVLIADLSRLSRSQDLAPMVERLRFQKVRVIGVLDGFDSDSPHARMQAGLSGLMSDEMRAQIRVRTHLALETRAKTSRATGGRAYGFDNAGAPAEPEASMVRDLFTRYAAGESMKDIVSDLNVRGVPSPGAGWNREKRRQDGRWLISALHAILHNDRYIGRVVWNRSTWVKDPDSGKRSRRERPESEWIVTEGPAIVDQVTWERAQRRLRERVLSYGGGAGGHPRYLLSGILQCAACRSRLIVTGANASHYYCSTHRQGGAAACDMKLGVRRDVAEALIVGPIKTDLLSGPAIARAVALIRQLHQQQRAHSAEQPDAEMQAIDAEIEDYTALIAQRPARGPTLRAAIEELHQRRAALQRQAWRQAVAMGPNDELPAERAYRDHVTRMAGVLDGKNMAAARAILKDVLGDVPVTPAETGDHLVAIVGINPMPLLRAAGIVASNGSGGMLWNQLHIPLRR